MTQTNNSPTSDSQTNEGGTFEGGTGDVVAELRALVAELVARVATLENQAAQRYPDVSAEVLLAISAACAAYLDERATVKQVHLRRGGGGRPRCVPPPSSRTPTCMDTATARPHFH